MNLQLVREPPTPAATTGQLYVDGTWYAFTLEPPDGAPEGAPIPEGRYPLLRYTSPHLGHDVLLLEDVPDRSEIEIHELNEACQSHGCIGVGFRRDGPHLLDSRHALDGLLARVEFPCYLNVLYGPVAYA